MAERRQVVIVGAGFGGIEAARALAKAPVDVTLIDRRNHHCFQPLLYQVATAALSPADIAWPIRSVLSGQSNLTVLMAAVEDVDTAARRVFTKEAALPYDVLVLATGATHSYFGKDAWEPFAPGLKEIEDATRIRRRLLLAFEQAEIAPDEAGRTALLTFAVIGAGPTGVEMAGAIAELARHTLTHEFRHFDPRSARIVLIEAGPRILPTFPEHLSGYALRALTRMGVEVLTGTLVTGCDAQGVDTAAGRIEASTLVWAAGVTASPASRWLGVETDRAGRVPVEPDLSAPGHPDIFVIGDTAAVFEADGRPVPGIAPAAKQMGRFVGRVIAARAVRGPAPGPFRYRHSGDLATVGRKAAVVKLDHLTFTGFIGWLFWSLAHVYFLIGVRNRFIVAFSWLWSYFTYQRGARLIIGADATPEPMQATEAAGELSRPSESN